VKETINKKHSEELKLEKEELEKVKLEIQSELPSTINKLDLLLFGALFHLKSNFRIRENVA